MLLPYCNCLLLSHLPCLTWHHLWLQCVLFEWPVMRVSGSNGWKPANLDKIQQLACGDTVDPGGQNETNLAELRSAASFGYGAGFGAPWTMGWFRPGGDRAVSHPVFDIFSWRSFKRRFKIWKGAMRDVFVHFQSLLFSNLCFRTYLSFSSLRYCKDRNWKGLHQHPMCRAWYPFSSKSLELIKASTCK